MSEFWKEEYTVERAVECGVHGHEGRIIKSWGDSKWIYFVEVLDFRFAFFSIEMLELYIDFFDHKVLPSSRFYGVSPFSNGPAASIGDGQSPFERLPSFLRKKNKKPKVLKALKQAKEEFTRST